MIANVIAFVPRILIDNRYDGAIMSMLIAIPISMSLCACMIWAMSRFPQQSITEIAARLLPKWLEKTVLLYFLVMWYLAGLITLYYFSDITKRFINPDFSPFEAMLLYAIALMFMIQMESRRALYMLEILLVLQVPFILFIMLKATINHNMMWDSMQEAATYVANMPRWLCVAAATHVFSGYLNLIIFNNVFHKPVKLWLVWIVGAVGILNLTTTYFIPIGMQGMDGVGKLIYMWFTTADSIRLEYGIIDRLIFVFLLLYLNISLLSAFVHWHVALQMGKALFGKRSEKTQLYVSWGTGGLFAGLAVAASFWIYEITMFRYTQGWLLFRLGSEAVLIGLLFVLVMLQKRRQAA